MDKHKLYSQEVQQIDLCEIVRRALNGADTAEGRHQAALALFSSPETVARFEAWDEVLTGLLCRDELADALHRARYHDDAEIVQRAEALRIGRMVLEVFNAAADDFVQSQVDHWGLSPDGGAA